MCILFVHFYQYKNKLWIFNFYNIFGFCIFFSLSFFHRYIQCVGQYLRCRFGFHFFGCSGKKEVSKSFLLRDRKLGQKLLTGRCLCVCVRTKRSWKQNNNNKRRIEYKHGSSSSVSFAFRSWCDPFACSLEPETVVNFCHPMTTCTCISICSHSARYIHPTIPPAHRQRRCFTSITNCAANHQLPPQPSQRGEPTDSD